MCLKISFLILILFFIKISQETEMVETFKDQLYSLPEKLSDPETIKNLVILYAGHSLSQENVENSFKIQEMMENLKRKQILKYKIKSDLSEKIAELNTNLIGVDDHVDTLETTISSKVIALRNVINTIDEAPLDVPIKKRKKILNYLSDQINNGSKTIRKLKVYKKKGVFHNKREELLKELRNLKLELKKSKKTKKIILGKRKINL